ncbi:ABC transporter permease [Rhodoferax koreense]|uniref:TRAP transporter large permease protein n=1 Tax=Rhodoferax koreensis TaxID=1842727 RepID=A0A1P8K1Y4_9BURK|nr:TRAP transporter large permease [Rhodoferax koreense]APW40024.1 ABC transporter permease [Rhodoferax koreense]
MTSLMLKISSGWLFTILCGLPLFASMGLAALAFLWLGGMPVTVLPQKMAGSMNSFPIIAAPLFVLMGNILGAARLTDRIVEFASTVIGWVRGGYAHASILTSMIFAGMVGSAVADAAGSGAIEIRAMKNAGYKPETAAAITAAAATIGPIIPPSLPMVIYGVTADVSIGKLFMAGVVPGILMGLSLMVMVGFVARREGMAKKPFAGFRAIGRAFLNGFFALMTPVVILGGMFSGLVTPTEAAAVACLYALFLGFVVYRTLEVKQLGPILIDTAETTGLVLVLVMAASALGWCVSISRLPQTLTPLIVGTIQSPVAFLLMANVLMLVVGCFMEALAAMLILIPILVPAAIQYGIDPVQFGVIMVLNLILGTIHPPIGVVLFVVTRIANISFETMSRAILPWLIPLLVVLIAISLWSPLTMWLPHLMHGQ